MAFELLWDLQNDHAIPIADRLSAWISDPQARLDVEATYQDARAIGEGSVEAGVLLAHITFPEDPGLLVTLKQAVADYGRGSVSLKDWLDADGPNTDSAGGLDGLQQLAAGASALRDANLAAGLGSGHGGTLALGHL